MTSSPPLPSWIPPRLLTVEEAAGLLHLSVRQLRRMIADGRLPIIRIGHSTRIAPETIAALIHSE